MDVVTRIELGAEEYEQRAKAHHARGVLSAENGAFGGAVVEFELSAKNAALAATCRDVAEKLRAAP